MPDSAVSVSTRFALLTTIGHDENIRPDEVDGEERFGHFLKHGRYSLVEFTLSDGPTA